MAIHDESGDPRPRRRAGRERDAFGPDAGTFSAWEGREDRIRWGVRSG
ncbi:hypothetical protein ACFQJD_09440 [Haloplanus sp. GCM10025708]